MIVSDGGTVKLEHEKTLKYTHQNKTKKVYCLNRQTRQRERAETKMKRARLHHGPVREESKGPRHQLITLSSSLHAAPLDKTTMK